MLQSLKRGLRTFSRQASSKTESKREPLHHFNREHIMKTTIIYIAVSLLLPLLAEQLQAQNRDQAVMGKETMFELAILYGNEIGLSEAQKREIAQIRAEHRIQMREMRSELRQQRGERSRRPQVRADLRNQMHEQIRGVLSEQQRQQLDRMRADRLENREEMQQLMSETYVEIVAEDIGLDQEKTAEIKAIVTGYRTGMRETRTERRTDMQQRNGEREEMRREHQAELMSRIRGVLTEEEFELWEQQWNEIMPAAPQRRGDRMNRERGNNRQN